MYVWFTSKHWHKAHKVQFNHSRFKQLSSRGAPEKYHQTYLYIYSIYDSIYNYVYIILWLNQEYTRWRNVCSMQYNKDPLLIYCLFGKTHGQPHRAIGTSLDSPFCDSLTPKLLPTTIPNKLQLYPKNWTVSMPIPSCRCSSHAPESLNPSV